ncbi:hypothetical protein ACQPXH_17405 [Nocardia sp. CA-135953]|uniref:hypothetical protein n=1 Tax=Nocardia sp. CA-135953 TaxID=3239978 RepID=UPI003D96AFA3
MAARGHRDPRLIPLATARSEQSGATAVATAAVVAVVDRACHHPIGPGVTHGVRRRRNRVAGQRDAVDRPETRIGPMRPFGSRYHRAQLVDDRRVVHLGDDPGQRIVERRRGHGPM